MKNIKVYNRSDYVPRFYRMTHIQCCQFNVTSKDFKFIRDNSYIFKIVCPICNSSKEFYIYNGYLEPSNSDDEDEWEYKSIDVEDDEDDET